MKKYEYLYYDNKNCPLAKKIEDTVNCSGGTNQRINRITEFMTEDDFTTFICACFCYWSESQYYDARNIVAVLASKKIIEQFPALKDVGYTEETLINAFGFTNCAHRYLQQELFNTGLFLITKRGTLGIGEWYEKMQFVIDNNHQMVPYAV